jgi:MFS family permease
VIPTRYITQLSFFIACGALFLLGPSKFFGFDKDSVPFTVAGLGLLGFTTATVFVPLLSEIIDAIEEKEKMKGNATINDKASALFNTAGAIGTIIGPIIGGLMDDALGF